MKPTNADIRHFIITHFNDSELETFCFDYFPEVKFTREMEFSHKVELLIGYCQRRSLEVNLLVNLQQERPQPFATRFSTKAELPPVVETKPRNPRQIFVSYAHEDGELAQRLALDLEAEGWPVWIAPDSIQPGEKWASAISRGLDESSVFALLLTPHAVKSPWVRSETDVAVEMEHDGELRFIPLLVEACRVPALWRAYQHIPFREGYEAGLLALFAVLTGERQTSDVSKASDTLMEQERPCSSRSLAEPESDTKRRIAKVTSGPVGRATLRDRDAATATEVKLDSFIHEKTELEYVCVPAGEFLYGDKKEKKHLPEFWMGKTQVTNEAYAQFVKDAGYKPPEHWQGGKPPADNLDHPVVNVSWHDAKAFCEWAGLRLPTEEEWEKGARGTDGREYAWGNEEPTRNLCNFGNNEGGTTPVGKYSPYGDSPYGCVDMSGNVWEWTESLYQEGKEWRVWRGGAFLNDSQYTRTAFRGSSDPGLRNLDVGFRVAEHLSDPGS